MLFPLCLIDDYYYVKSEIITTTYTVGFKYNPGIMDQCPGSMNLFLKYRVVFGGGNASKNNDG